tara:strand:- start:423 stop:704 length:282 start_codon:yes stop_codon:yes gene_type:complete
MKLANIPDANNFLKILMPNFDKWSDIMLKRGFKEIRHGFLKRTIPIGKEITVKTTNKSTTGRFFGLNNDGSLILNCSTGQIFVTAGDVLLVGK